VSKKAKPSFALPSEEGTNSKSGSICALRLPADEGGGRTGGGGWRRIPSRRLPSASAAEAEGDAWAGLMMWYGIRLGRVCLFCLGPIIQNDFPMMTYTDGVTSKRKVHGRRTVGGRLNPVTA
jgi:hypothetical protein